MATQENLECIHPMNQHGNFPVSNTILRVCRSITEPIRVGNNWDERWGSIHLGLITSWERGREMSTESPAIAEAARNGQLIILPWKGGVEKKIKKTEKFGTLNYLAMWQGLRGENLDIDINTDKAITCSVTNMIVTFTNDIKKYMTS